MLRAGHALVGLPIADAAGARSGSGRVAWATWQAPPCCRIQTESVDAREAAVLAGTGARPARVAALLAALFAGREELVRQAGHAGVLRQQGLLGARRARSNTGACAA